MYNTNFVYGYVWVSDLVLILWKDHGLRVCMGVKLGPDILEGSWTEGV
jgi:hypothetical protein